MFSIYFTGTLFLGGFIALVSSSVAYTSEDNRNENKYWFFSNIFAAIWSFSYLTMIVSADASVSYIANLVLHGAAIFIPLFYFAFILELTNQYARYRVVLLAYSFVAVFFLIVNPLSYFVVGVVPKYVFNFAPVAGPLYIYFAGYFFLLVLHALTVLWKRRFHSKDDKEKNRFSYIFFSSVFGFAGGGSVFFLTFGVNLPPYPLILFALYPVVISYAMYRHKIFNARPVAIQAFVMLLWVILGGLIFLADTRLQRLTDGLLLLVSIVVGIFLIRDVVREIRTREKMETLATEIQEANNRLQWLEKQKSEFLSIASHQLRSPLTAIKGYASMILEGSFGEVPFKAHSALERIAASSERLVVLVEDFLNISRIEQGRMKYHLGTVKLDELISDASKSFERNLANSGLKLKVDIDGDGPFDVTADYGKIRQVLVSILDNAVKFTEHGGITIRLARDKASNVLHVQIKDTGLGIKKELLPILFDRFQKERKQKDFALKGTGFGLFVSKKIVLAHGGKIWVESEGEGQGSTFHVTLPIS